jgi:hypothetical protein
MSRRPAGSASTLRARRRCAGAGLQSGRRGRGQAVGFYSGALRCDNGENRLTLKRHANTVKVLSFAAGGKLLASGGHDDRVTLWDAATGKELASIPRKVTAGFRPRAAGPPGHHVAVGM